MSSPLIPLFPSAICSSPAASLNHRARSGTYRWFTTVVFLNILSCTTLTSFTLKSLLFDKSTGQRASAANFTLTHDTRVSAAPCSTMNYVYTVLPHSHVQAHGSFESFSINKIFGTNIVHFRFLSI